MRRFARISELLVVVLISPLLIACLWDRDTLTEEAKGRGADVEVLVGWFDRYPDKYYSMRLQRVLGELSETPENLGLYDDAAVALDRLHRSDEAIAMMAGKKAVLDALPDSEEKKEHQYRYLANLGTFHAHRWLMQSREQREAGYGDLELAEKYISEAIELNPDAHFGREKYQLYAIQWLNPARSGDIIEVIESRNLLVMASDLKDWKEAVEGLSGMVRLGAAWQSVDIYAALAEAHSQGEDASLALLANLRVKELLDRGKESLHYDGRIQDVPAGGGNEALEDPKPVEQWYVRARRAADMRHELRLLYMRERFAKGEHPDTHPDFWNDWREMELPKMPGGTSLQDDARDQFIKTGMIAVCSLLVMLIFLRWWIKKSQQRSAPAEFRIG